MGPLQQAVAAEEEDDEFWRGRDALCELRPGRRAAADGPPPPLHLVAGWHDFFAASQLADFELASRAQPACRLTVTPHDHWGMASLRGLQVAVRAGLSTFDAHLGDGGPAWGGTGRAWPPLRGVDSRPAIERALPVQVCFLGTQRWAGFGAWPPTRGAHELHATLTPAAELLWVPTPPKPARAEEPQAAPRTRPSAAAPAPAPPAPPAAAPAAASSRVAALVRRVSRLGAPSSPGTGLLEPAPAAARLGGAELPPQLPALPSGASLTYLYSPSAPTPACGGPSFNILNGGERSQASVERRRDVLVFSSARLPEPLTVAGPVGLTVRVAAAAPSIDVVGRLCLVTDLGGSVNLCEGMLRLRAPMDAASGGAQVGGGVDGPGVEARVELGPVAAEFPRGSRVRLHVCSAAHPRWMRNLCDDPRVPLGEQRTGMAAKVRVWVDGSSRLVLPSIPSEARRGVGPL